MNLDGSDRHELTWAWTMQPLKKALSAVQMYLPLSCQAHGLGQTSVHVLSMSKAQQGCESDLQFWSLHNTHVEILVTLKNDVSFFISFGGFYIGLLVFGL